MADKKSRNFAQIVYPESLPDNWIQYLQSLHVPIAVSPLHSPDNDEEGGRKPHYHIIYHFDGPKTIDNVQELAEPLNGTRVIIVNSINAQTRYLTHKDDPLKQQFDELPMLFGGYDYETYLENTLSKKLRYQYIQEMCKFVSDSGMCEFCDLFDYAMQYYPDTWFPALCDSSAYIIGEYLKSYRMKNRYPK